MGKWIALVIIVVVIVALLGSLTGVWNTLNAKYQAVNEASSHYSAALNTSTEKIKGVWAMSQQYLDHESSTFKGVAEARSGFLAAKEAYQQAQAGGKTSQDDLTKLAMLAQQKFLNLQSRAGLAINVQIEAYPQLRGADTTQQAMRSMEVGVNEIKTSLDDWITTIKDYNTYRGSAWPSIAGSFMSKYPASIKYYEGDTKKLNIDELNPKNQP